MNNILNICIYLKKESFMGEGVLFMLMFVWVVAMLVVLFKPIFLWKKGILMSFKDLAFIYVGMLSIGAVSLFGILSEL